MASNKDNISKAFNIQRKFLKDIQSKESRKLQKSLKDLVEDCYKNTILKVYPYIDPILIKNLFPGIDLSNIESYDFSKTQIDLYVLSREEIREFNKKRGQMADVGGYSIYCLNIEKRKELIGGKPVIVISERVIEAEREKDLTEKERDILLKMRYSALLTHEFLHTLGIGIKNENSKSFYLAEGFTEYLTYTVSNSGNPLYCKYSELFFKYPPGYTHVTLGVRYLVKSLRENGISWTILIKGFGRSLKEELDIIWDKLTEIYGPKGVENIIKNIKEKPYRFNVYMKDLYNKTHSD
jgi:hypothetical protein